MNIVKINDIAGDILEFLEAKDSKLDEKIAALETAGATIRAIINAEALRINCVGERVGYKKGANIMEIEDVMIAKREAEKEIKDAMDNAIEKFRRGTSCLPNSISIHLGESIMEGWSLRVRVQEVNINI